MRVRVIFQKVGCKMRSEEMARLERDFDRVADLVVLWIPQNNCSMD